MDFQEKIISIKSRLDKVKSELAKVIVGQEVLVERLLIALIVRGHVLVEGVPGLAKTLTITSLSKIFSGESARIQFTPDMLPSDITGVTIYNGKTQEFTIKKGPVFSNFILADEINRAPAKTQSALLEAMQERQVTLNGEKTLNLPELFFVMATQNPIEQEGTYPLPEAQLDRFLMKLNISYLNRTDEKKVMRRMTKVASKQDLDTILDLSFFNEVYVLLDTVSLSAEIEEYILDIIYATRPGSLAQLSSKCEREEIEKLYIYIEQGVSPRATMAFVLLSKAFAILQGRSYVVPEDIKLLAKDILRHRIILSYHAESQQLTMDDVIDLLLSKLVTP